MAACIRTVKQKLHNSQVILNDLIFFAEKNMTLIFTFSRWPDGKYCIYKKGSGCPTGLDEGFVIWDDENKDNKNSKDGELPEGLFNEDTKIFFCCSTSGSASKEIILPNIAPFLLFAYDSIRCQKVS